MTTGQRPAGGIGMLMLVQQQRAPVGQPPAGVGAGLQRQQDAAHRRVPGDRVSGRWGGIGRALRRTHLHQHLAGKSRGLFDHLPGGAGVQADEGGHLGPRGRRARHRVHSVQQVGHRARWVHIAFQPIRS